MRDTIGIIGTGRVGTAIGYTLSKKNYNIIANDQNQNKARSFFRLLKLKFHATTNCEVARKADIIFIMTQDSEIEKVYKQILPCLKQRAVVVQCSGAISNAIFKRAKQKRIFVIGLHPIQTFSTIKQSLTALKNTYYAIEANGTARQIAKRLVKDLGGKPIFINGKNKPLYHTMCVFASNYLVALLSAVIDIAKELKIKPAIAFKTLEPLIYQTLDNIRKSGIEKSLTGPIERGDINTIKSHLKALNNNIPELLPLYCAFGLKTIRIAKPNKQTKNLIKLMLM